MIHWLTSGAALASQFVNWLFLWGNHDQTVSARCYVNRHRPGWGRAYQILNRIFFWQEDHCRSSHMSDVRFAQQILLNKWM